MLLLLFMSSMFASAANTPEVPVEPLTAEIGKGARPTLYNLPLAHSRYELPASYVTARELFASAYQDFADEAPELAAPKFMAVAALLKAPKPATTYSVAFADMRLASYRNAVLCFQEAGDAEGARKALAKALQQDAENAEAIKKLVAGIR